VVGNDVQIGGNTNTANRLFNGREVEIYVEIDGRKQIFPTGLNLFGVIIGDETGVGGNVLFNPGTIVGRQCQVYPKISVSGYIAHNMIIRPKASPLEIIPKSGRKVK
jgi:NDP-sugar pyrophosphorylase family protein